MNLQELSIGNWVYNKHHGKAIQITPFDFFTHIHRDGEQYLIGNPNLVSGKDFEPIPITPEILEKNGIKKEYNILYDDFYHNDNFSITKVVDEWLVRIGATNSLYVKYVHQLQNALTLCGIDKEIKLL